MNEVMGVWTQKKLESLIEWYPKKGKVWCMENLGLTEGQVRTKASLLGLKAMGVSDAWRAGCKARGKTIAGRKRPEQAVVMKAVNDKMGPRTEVHRKKLSEATKQRLAKDGHPRGMLGRKHSDEAKEKMSVSGQKRVKRESPEIRSERALKGLQTKLANGSSTTSARLNCSWKAGWREIGQQKNFFRSRWEANYGRFLQFLLEKGEISKWEHEPETFWFEGIKRGAVSYLPDFRVTFPDGSVEYHEVKGWMDDRSKTKIRRMAKYHPSVVLIVIDSKTYKTLSKQLGRLVSGWEA